MDPFETVKDDVMISESLLLRYPLKVAEVVGVDNLRVGRASVVAEEIDPVESEETVEALEESKSVLKEIDSELESEIEPPVLLELEVVRPLGSTPAPPFRVVLEVEVGSLMEKVAVDEAMPSTLVEVLLKSSVEVVKDSELDDSGAKDEEKTEVVGDTSAVEEVVAEAKSLLE